jgi:hypothetical protein
MHLDEATSRNHGAATLMHLDEATSKSDEATASESVYHCHQ